VKQRQRNARRLLAPLLSLLALAGCRESEDSDRDSSPSAGAGGADGDAGAAGTGGGVAGSAGQSAGGAGAGGEGGSLGAAGSGGAASEYTEREWSYVPIDGAICRNGKPTGIFYNPNPSSDKLLVFLEEGAACFNQFSCLAAFKFDAGEADERIAILNGSYSAMNRETPNNPFADWNIVFVPYCSGDIYAGNAENVEVAGNTYQFKGYNNVTLIFDWVIERLPNPSQVVLSGASAGGWGAGYNYPKARRMFPESDVILIDDSASFMGNEYLAPCWQKRLRETWNLDSTMPADCTECLNSEDGSFAEQLIRYTLETYPDFRGGLLETAEDGQMRLMLGFGENDCELFDVMTIPDYPAEKFTAGLIDLRDNIVGPYEGFRVFFDTGDTHAFISHSSYGGDLVSINPPRMDVEVEGVAVWQWLQAAVDGGEWKSVSAF